MKEDIFIDEELCAIILRSDYDEPGLFFFTAKEYSQQLASMSYPPGKMIAPHTHNIAPREVSITQEALFVRKGKLRIDFYTSRGEYRRSRMLQAGDVILLIAGGHGFEVLEELNMVEVKQGPYCEQNDKLHFICNLPDQLNFE